MEEHIKYMTSALGILEDIEIHLNALKKALHEDSEFFKKFYSISSIEILGLQTKKLSLMNAPQDLSEEHGLLRKITDKAYNLSGLFSLKDSKFIGEFDELFDVVMSDIKCLRDRLFSELFSFSTIYPYDEEWVDMPDVGFEITD